MKKNNKILVFGNFGYLTNSLDGQTVKTRNIYDVLKKNEKIIGEVRFFDDRELLRKKISFISLIIELIKCERLIYIPAIKNLRYFFPLIFCLSKLFHFKIVHISIGGRNNDFLNNNKLHRFMLSKIHAYLPEIRSEVDELKVKYNYTNVSYFPNFRIHKFNPGVEINDGVDFKICFMARITPLKGVNSVIRLANSLLSNPINNKKIKIDFYGPIDNEFKKEFLEKINTNSIINYLGILNPKDIYINLSKYDVLVLPTKYPGEGFPGTILDSYISAVPVIVSKWRCLPEFVKHKKTGFIYNLDDEEEFYDYVRYLILNPKIVYKMKLNAIEESKLYSEKIAWKILKKHIEI